MPISSTPAKTLPRPELAAIGDRQHGAWSSGDYAVVGTRLQIVGETLCEALDVRAGWRVLDVAAGNGNVARAAARRWCDVVATDYVPALLECARGRAYADRLPLACRTADAEDLPFPDESFDAVVSTFGVLFAPDQERAAAGRSVLRTGLRSASSDSSSRRSASTYHPRPPSHRPRGGEPAPDWRSCSRSALRSQRASAIFHFDTARPGIGSRCSRPATARCSRRSRPWSRPRKPPCTTTS